MFHKLNSEDCSKQKHFCETFQSKMDDYDDDETTAQHLVLSNEATCCESVTLP
jgi:hypothetical protein